MSATSTRAGLTLLVLGAAAYWLMRARSDTAASWGEWPIIDVGALMGAGQSYQAAPDDSESVAGLAEGEGGALATVADYLLPVAYRVGAQFGGNYMRTSLAGIAEIARHEGFKPYMYNDQAGYPTIGYGHKVKPGESFTRISEAEARALLIQDVGTAEDAVNAAVTVSLNQAQFDALVSLVYNIGVGAFRTSTLLRKLNAGDYASAQQQFLAWRKVRIGGTLTDSAGLINRRTAEAALFGSGGYA